MSRDAFENGRRAHQPMATQLPQPTVTLIRCVQCHRFAADRGTLLCGRCMYTMALGWPDDEDTQT